MRTRKLTIEHKIRISKSCQGKKRSKEFVKKNSENNQGSKNTWAFLTEEHSVDIREMRQDGVRVIEIAEMYGVHPDTIYKLLRGQTWKHTLEK